MENDGPLLETLTRRLAECPPEFLAEPRIGKVGSIEVGAVVADLLSDLGGPLPKREQAIAFKGTDRRRDRNRLRTILVAAWLLHDGWFRTRKGLGPAVVTLLHTGLDELAGLLPAPQLVSDPDRREELARMCLQALGLRPAGETVAEAQDRLTTLNSLERQRVIREAEAAEARARKVREAMARKAAEEAAAKWGRE